MLGRASLLMAFLSLRVGWRGWARGEAGGATALISMAAGEGIKKSATNKYTGSSRSIVATKVEGFKAILKITTSPANKEELGSRSLPGIVEKLGKQNSTRPKVCGLPLLFAFGMRLVF